MNKFEYPEMFLLLILPFVFYNLLPKTKGLHGDAIRLPFINDIKNIKSSTKKIYSIPIVKSFLFSLKFVYLFALWALLVTAVARPIHIGDPYRTNTENRDIMLVIDISPSMMQPDFHLSGKNIDRLSAVKLVVSDFIKNRVEDRVGLILFATRAYLQSPLTYDKQAVMDILLNTEAGMAGDSTAIGDALGIALKNVKKEQNIKNKVIILLTDGDQTDGSLSLPKAIDLAEKEGVKIYTIGVGLYDSLFGGFMKLSRSSFDEKSLKEIADKTKGSYFRAKDMYSLKKVYKKIDELEPQSSQGNIIQEKDELFYIPLAIALILSVFLLFIPRSYFK